MCKSVLNHTAGVAGHRGRGPRRAVGAVLRMGHLGDPGAHCTHLLGPGSPAARLLRVADCAQLLPTELQVACVHLTLCVSALPKTLRSCIAFDLVCRCTGQRRTPRQMRAAPSLTTSCQVHASVVNHAQSPLTPCAAARTDSRGLSRLRIQVSDAASSQRQRAQPALPELATFLKPEAEAVARAV